MITQLYRERTAADLKNRISKVLLNGNETKIVELTIQGAIVKVLTQREEDIKHIKSVQILDEQNNVITERTTNLDVSNNRTLDFRITFEVV
ncbi:MULTISPECIES: hypothetical protein [Bacillus subtilis group]|uniref:hypothetical protein n=1 Tax=Bacillus subtilis group TaxID=653685 RepID=UPI000751041B|nr:MULTISPECIES: hypothetical protein [Bacillus subtilis group]KUP41804.1 hypothetical protein AU384_02385 [Bacillus halotolerans]MDP0484541.1 hypothetical protein [Bacillus subtilis]WEY87189.1 hypothetical protein P5628_13030 [Bacillus subtilis]WEZ18483.1 hypothetical protein P5661_13730 [Bacillus subtilis]